MLLELIEGSTVKAAIDISIRVERDMDIGVSEPVLQNDRFHSGLDAPRSESVPKRVLSMKLDPCLFTDPPIEAVDLRS